MIEVQRAQVEEVPEIKRVLSSTWIDTYGEIYSEEAIQKITSRWHAPELLASQIQNPDFFFGVAKENGVIVGLTTVRKLDKETLFMYRLYISPDRQRQGIGSRLLDEALRIFPGIKRIKLEVEERNHKAISFYEKMGFKEVGRKVEEVEGEKRPLIEMEKKLS